MRGGKDKVGYSDVPESKNLNLSLGKAKKVHQTLDKKGIPPIFQRTQEIVRGRIQDFGRDEALRISSQKLISAQLIQTLRTLRFHKHAFGEPGQ